MNIGQPRSMKEETLVKHRATIETLIKSINEVYGETCTLTMENIDIVVQLPVPYLMISHPELPANVNTNISLEML